MSNSTMHTMTNEQFFAYAKRLSQTYMVPGYKPFPPEPVKPNRKERRAAKARKAAK